MPGWLRLRLPYLALAAGTIVVGLTVHWTSAPLGRATRDVLGDAIWAVMMVWWISALAPGSRLVVRAGAALAVCFAVEGSQTVHTPGLDAVRRTTMGALALGSDFDPRDLAAYTVGVLVACGLEVVSRRARYASPTTP
jgi:hypothetical protein